MSEFGESILKNLILPVVKDIALPKIQSIFKKFQIRNTDEESVEKQLHEYLKRRYTKFETIDTLVLTNSPTKLEDFYQPLTVSYLKRYEGEKVEKKDIKIDRYPGELLPLHKKVIIEDTAGMGKSTIIKKLFLSIIEQKVGIPVLIELSRIKEKNSILKEIQNQMSSIGKKINQDVILKLINEGNFIFLFDGYDEIALADREFTIRELHSFIEKAGDNYFLITSRPEESLASFGDFQKFHVNPLEKKEAYELLKKYDKQSYHKIADNLINELKDSDESLEEYLENPFLVSLLHKSYEYKKDIPLKKTQFYEQVYDALFEAHDLSKEGYLKREKYSKLHKDDFQQVLRGIAYFSSMANKIEYDKNTIIQFIKKAKKQTSGLQFKNSDYLKDLLNTVPLFKKAGNNFKWAHKSLQDYFAAKFIQIDTKENRIPILRKIFEDEENQRFYSILLLYCELDTKGFEHTILKWFLTKFKNYVEINDKSFSIKREIIKRRIECNFGRDYLFLSVDYEDLYNEETFIRFFNKSFNKKNLNINKFNFFDYRQYAFIIDGYPNTDYILFLKESKLFSTTINILKNTHIDLLKKDFTDFNKLKKSEVFSRKLICKVNYDKTNWINSTEYFDIFNDLISYRNPQQYNYNLNYDKALEKLKKLEKNNPEKEKNELLDW
ncbi:NACHT domain-containing protein [Kordia periserrulae]|uniref:NACHT domain-containing protein n=1 Tax=Kordia periserrulae TaxID=701523 RepID=A0A2T6C6P1_9FLAO|nr:NACHT domain-containing protein [Kordia periserrulae]PTX63991.1 NACHT domain-containing protein [Kordia periserrulae]